MTSAQKQVPLQIPALLQLQSHIPMVLKSFVEVQHDSHFPLENLPYGIFKPQTDSDPRPGVAIGNYILDLSVIASAGLFDDHIILNTSDCFYQPNLNTFLVLGPPAWKEVRSFLQKLLSAEEPILRDNVALRQKALVPMDKAQMLLPVAIGDYTDFNSSEHHTRNCGKMFVDEQNPIHPSWYHLPVAYHGRASSIVISGTDIIRPRGQAHPVNGTPYFGPSKKMDFELEMATVIGPGNELGKPVGVNEAADHIFGLVLMNDWSARDIQAWEMLPLGPFLGKSFATTISPWIVTLDALEQFSVDAPTKIPPPLSYLNEQISRSYNISLQVLIKPVEQDDSYVVTESNFKNLYWSITQQLAHHTVNGCNMRPGDLLGTGTISGPEPDSLGSLLEITWNGQKSLSLGRTKQTFLEDGDEVVFTGFCKGDGYLVGFGTCSGKVIAALA